MFKKLDRIWRNKLACLWKKMIHIKMGSKEFKSTIFFFSESEYRIHICDRNLNDFAMAPRQEADEKLMKLDASLSETQ
ncbi:MAG: hypothetical protein ACMUHX_10325 [bacterium]